MQGTRSRAGRWRRRHLFFARTLCMERPTPPADLDICISGIQKAGKGGGNVIITSCTS